VGGLQNGPGALVAVGLEHLVAGQVDARRFVALIQGAGF
jgi:hypothetical protein